MDFSFEPSRHPYNLRKRKETFVVGQQVWKQLNAPTCLSSEVVHKYEGPFIIRKRLTPWNYELADKKRKFCGVFKAQELKKITDGSST